MDRRILEVGIFCILGIIGYMDSIIIHKQPELLSGLFVGN